MASIDLTWHRVGIGVYRTPIVSDHEFWAEVSHIGDEWHLTTLTFDRPLSSEWHRTLDDAKASAASTLYAIAGV